MKRAYRAMQAPQTAGTISGGKARRRTWGVWTVLLGLSLGAGGILSHPAVEAGPATASKAGTAGTSVAPSTHLEIYTLGPAPASLHPFLLSASTNGIQLSPFVLERLGQLNEKQNTLELPLLELPEMGVSQVRHSLRLKPGTRFSNGQPLTANDVAASFQRLQQAARAPGAPLPTQALARCFFLLEEVRASSALQLELTFRRPVRGEELAPMLATLPLIPADATDEALSQGIAPTLGAFVVTQKASDRIDLRANALYPFGVPYISNISLHYLSTDEMSTLLTESSEEKGRGQLFVLPPSLAAQAMNRADLQVRVTESHRVLVIGFNQLSGSRFAGNSGLRRAVASLIDPQALQEGLPMPEWLRTPLTGPYVLDRRYEALQRTLPQLKFDLTLGRTGLEKQGFTRVGETLRDANGEPLVLTLAVDGRVPSGMLLGGLVREQLLREGLEVKVVAINGGSLAGPAGGATETDATPLVPDLLLQEWFMDEDDGYTELLHSRGVFNPLHLKDTTLDELLTLERSAMLLPSRERYRREIQTRMVETASALWLWQRREAVAIGTGLRTAAALDPYYLFRSVHHWSIGDHAPDEAVQAPTQTAPPARLVPAGQPVPASQALPAGQAPPASQARPASPRSPSNPPTPATRVGEVPR